MNQAEKEQYLREYGLLKNKGKPFYPYAVAKDSIMAVIVMIVIMVLALLFGASLGPKVNPTTTTYVPRPDWYLYFLFEVLRVMKNVPKFTPFAAIGVSTVCMILLFLLPLYDRSPERLITKRPVALATGIATIIIMAFLTYSGASTGSPNQVSLKPPASLGLTASEKATFIQGEAVAGESGCGACHEIGSNGNNGPGPPLTHIGSKREPAAIASTLRNPTAPMPSFAGLARKSPKQFEALVEFLSDLK